jgi:poly-gamma-glutamate synthase PgsB/CapB
MIGLILVLFAAGALAGAWHQARARHDETLEQLHVRVHVNGIRGKSSVTRLVAAVLREGGYVTVAKTTGSAARVIGPSGEETPIDRAGAPTVNEQLEIVKRHVNRDVEALVIECMAVNPIYQKYAQESIVRSDITIITNVREDHQEVMGETLEQIADSMSVTIPAGGTLITAEERPGPRSRLLRNTAKRRAEFHYADATAVTDADMVNFDYLEFRSNVAIGLKVAEILGIDRAVAMRGMWKAVPDVGALQLSSFAVEGKDILWVPLFAANDRESVVAIFEMLAPQLAGRTTIGILNNRWDRGRRAELFADMAARDLQPFLDHVVTFGAYEPVVTNRLIDNGYPKDRITNLGETVRPTLNQVVGTIAQLIPGQRGAIIGLVNIHTAQAEMLLHYLNASRGANNGAEVSMSLEERRLPEAVRRYRNAVRTAAVSRSVGIHA